MADLIQHEDQMDVFENLVRAYRREEGQGIVDSVDLGIFFQILRPISQGWKGKA